MARDQKMKELILHILRGASEDGMSRSTLRQTIGNCDAKRLTALLREMRKEGLLRLNADRRLVLTEKQGEPLQGVVRVNSQGFGFVRLSGENQGEQDVFIPPGALLGAISGDLVELQLDQVKDSRGPSGSVRRIVKRKHDKIVGCLVKHGQGWALRPLRRELPALISLQQDEKGTVIQRSKEGDWVEARLLQEETEDGQLYAQLSSRIAASGSVRADLNAIVKEFDLPRKYSTQQETRAAELQAIEMPREDCSELLTVTIDPLDARDYDDALSLLPGRDAEECIVAVHIADVACYVPYKSSLDKEALKRGFTSYLPGRTLPMLPAALSNDLCSLREGLPRAAHSLFMRISLQNGKVISFERKRTTIKVNKRLCYDDLMRLFEAEKSGLEPEIKKMLLKLRSVAAKLRAHRQKNELFLPMEMPEIRVLCSEQPSKIIGLQKTEHDESHALIEEFMLAANQCIAEELRRKKIPALFRNHAEPEADSMLEFSVQVAQICGRKFKRFGSRKQLVAFLKDLAKHPMRELLQMAFLRHLPRANYGAAGSGHFGLGKSDYCHFTSPIRRYPDLLIHQQLLALDRKESLRGAQDMLTLAETLSALEENCDQASFAAADRMKLRFLLKQKEDYPMLRLRGYIIRSAKSGLSVYLPDYSLMGFVNAWQLPKKDWRFFSDGMLWKNHSSGDLLQAQMEMEFLINTNDPIRGELTLTPFFSSSAKKEKETEKKTGVKAAGKRKRSR
ncbi:MAG: ribonuclease R family protein [Lentisphaeria bacterium]